MAEPVFLIAGLLPHKHRLRPDWAFAEDSLGGVDP
jgi:hypothetical protein